MCPLDIGSAFLNRLQSLVSRKNRLQESHRGAKGPVAEFLTLTSFIIQYLSWQAAKIFAALIPDGGTVANVDRHFPEADFWPACWANSPIAVK